MTAGLPVVATRSGGIVDAVENGRTGFLVERGDSNALAEALVTLLLNPGLRREMGLNGSRQAIGRCSWERVIPSLRELYESLSGIPDGAIRC
jgi:glycosyltransferase involved in cell wall biosynthesis